MSDEENYRPMLRPFGSGEDAEVREETPYEVKQRLDNAVRLIKGVSHHELNEFHHSVNRMLNFPSQQDEDDRAQRLKERELLWQDRLQLARYRGECK